MFVAPQFANAAILWSHPELVAAKDNGRGVVVLSGAPGPRDDTSADTLYFKFRVTPKSDTVTKIEVKPYMAGLVFSKKGEEKLGLGCGWSAFGFSAFSKTFKPKAGNDPGEFTLNTEAHEGEQRPYLAPRRDVSKVVLVKVEYAHGGDDRVTVWFDPDLSTGATEQSQSPQIVTRFSLDASFDELRAVHRGAGEGWVFDRMAVATAFEDFVPIPLWHRAWFLALGTGLSALGVAGVVLAVERRRALRRERRIERDRVLSEERVRIARDLHDDLGARLTEIVLLGEVSARPGSAPKDEAVREILDGLRRLHTSLDEAVWSINPRNDSTEGLVEFVVEFAERFMRNAPMEFRAEVTGDIPRVPLSSRRRHNLLLAVKEALNNAVRHSGASRITLRVDFAHDRVRMSVIDDGRGLDDSRAAAGDGLRNMRERLIAAGGTAEIRGAPGGGTEVAFELPLNE